MIKQLLISNRDFNLILRTEIILKTQQNFAVRLEGGCHVSVFQENPGEKKKKKKMWIPFINICWKRNASYNLFVKFSFFFGHWYCPIPSPCEYTDVQSLNWEGNFSLNTPEQVNMMLLTFLSGIGQHSGYCKTCSMYYFSSLLAELSWDFFKQRIQSLRVSYLKKLR